MDGLIEAAFEIVVAMAEPVLNFLVEMVSAVLFQFAASALCCVLFTPIVLIRACFSPGHYLEKVVDGYSQIIATGFWM